MMNDRFSAELRQHLLATADERPADGRLAAIIDGVAVTAQRHPIMAGLTWVPRRTGVFPSAAVRYGLLAAALLIALVAAALFAGNGARRTVFEGTWTSVDPGDGSTQTLVVGGGPSPAVHFEDDFATGLACRDAEVKVFTMDGLGTVVDHLLDVVWPDGGGCGRTKVVIVPGSYTYDLARDTITDGQELTWTRVRGSVSPPAPKTQPTAEPTVEPTADPIDSGCVDLEDGGVYAVRLASTLVSDGLKRVTMTVPAAPLTPWQGSSARFDLSAACQPGAPIAIRATIVTTVYADGCDTGGSGVEVRSYDEAVAQFAAQRGHTTAEVAGADTIGGLPARRWAIDFDSGACGALDLWNGVNIADGSALVYMIDVEGVALGIFVYFADDPRVTLDQRDEAESIVSTLDVDPTVGPEASDPIAFPDCIQFDQAAMYTANAGSLPVSVTVPGTPGAPWQGGPDGFGLRRAKCGPDGVGLPLIHARVLDHVYADACHWKGTAVLTPTAADVVDALRVQTGHDTVGPIETTLGPYSATRFDLSIPDGFDKSTCDRDGLPWVSIWDGEILVGGGTKRVYVADVDGAALVVTVGYYPDEVATTALDEVDAILASLRVGA